MSEKLLPPDTSLGYVHLTVSDLDRTLAFYEEVLGFKLLSREGNIARLGTRETEILRLTHNSDARPADGTTGLYHFAILVPSRLELARSLRRLAESRWPLQGVADHLVSEALYLADPEGNGIEIYRDRPRDEWPYRDGKLQMATDPLDLEDIIAELDGEPDQADGLHTDTVLGHMHLHVADVREAEAFYVGVLGFELMLHFGPSAGFVSAGGYHHHIGFNTWGTLGATPPPPDSTGLREFVIYVPGDAEFKHVLDRLRSSEVDVEKTDDGLLVADPSRNGIRLTAQS